jgi:hypothetical protein
VAYRFEPLVCSSNLLKPVLIPHHKGRKRLHLELKEGLIRVEDYKQKMYQQLNTGLKNAWSSITEFAKMTSPAVVASAQPASINNESSMQQQESVVVVVEQKKVDDSFVEIEMDQASSSGSGGASDTKESSSEARVDFGKICSGRRVDYVLQERPIESFNEYLFAVASHACYWESEDTLLFIVKEIYDLGHLTDAHTELQLTEQQQQQYSWLTQTAVSTLNVNLQKTFNYFNSFGLPKSFSSVLTAAPSAPTSAATNQSAESNQSQTKSS